MSSDEEFQENDEDQYDSEEEALLEEELEAGGGGGNKGDDDEGDFIEGEEEDGEADYRPGKKKRRKEHKHEKSSKRRKTSSGKLINLKELREIEAEASSDASEDENEAWAEELMGEDHLRFIADDGEEPHETNYMKLNRALRDDQTASDYDIVRRIEERSRNQQYLEEEGHEEDPRGIISKGSREPSILNKLWLVKVVVGMERQIVVQLMQKFFTKQAEGTPLSILSVVSQEHLKGYIYVEANKEAHVREAITNMDGIFQKQVSLVPLGEMVSVLSVPKKKVSLARGDWVRVKRGAYADDIAQVHEYDETQQQVTIKIIPRLNWENRGYTDDDMDVEGPANRFKKRGKEVKLPQKLFNSDEIVAIHGQASVDRYRDQSGEVFLKFDNNKFKDGFLYKTIHVRALNTQDIVPTLEELKAFTKVAADTLEEEADPGEIRDREERALLIQAKKLARPKTTFAKGEMVQVTEGELKSMIGVVTSISAHLIHFQPSSKYGLGVQGVPPTQLSKYFSIGDHVKCTNGKYQGDTGLIVKLEEDTATVLSDTGHQELKVLTSDLQTCVEVSTGAKLGDYSLFDLVMLGVDSAGVIVSIDNNVAQVLETNAKTRPVRVGEIKSKKDSKNAISNDMDRNPIGKGDNLKVTSGPCAGASGQVKHIYRFWAFLQDKTLTKNNGVFVVRTRDCKLVGSSKNSFNPTMQRARTDNNFGTRPSYGFGNKQRTRARDEELVGKDVEILEGPWKGHIGLVRSAGEKTIYVQLATNVMKKIQIAKECVRPVGLKKRPEDDYRGAQTPMRAQTPLHTGVATPLHEGYAPTLGGQTPMRISTPYDGDTWSAREDYQTPENPYGLSESRSFSSSVPNYYPTPEPSDPYSTPSNQTPYTGFGTPLTPYGYSTPNPMGYSTPLTPASMMNTPGGYQTPNAYEIPPTPNTNQ